MRLRIYHWLGNVREFEKIIERAVINTSGSTLTLPDEQQPVPGVTGRLLQPLGDMGCRCIIEVLEQTSWKVSGTNSAAEFLGLKRSTLRAKMKKCNIQKP